MLSNEQHRTAVQPLIPGKWDRESWKMLHTQFSDVNDPREELHTHFDVERKPSSLCSVFT